MWIERTDSMKCPLASTHAVVCTCTLIITFEKEGQRNSSMEDQNSDPQNRDVVAHACDPAVSVLRREIERDSPGKPPDQPARAQWSAGGPVSRWKEGTHGGQCLHPHVTAVAYMRLHVTHECACTHCTQQKARS